MQVRKDGLTAPPVLFMLNYFFNANAKITIISDRGSRFLVMLKDGVVPPQGMGKEAAWADVLEV